MDRAEAEAILDGDRETAIALLMRIGELIEANRRLDARVAELEKRLNHNSHNSSLPPSQDPPSAPSRPPKPQSGRKPGGQPSHHGKNRKLPPLEEVARSWSIGQSAALTAAIASARRRFSTEAPPSATRSASCLRRSHGDRAPPAPAALPQSAPKKRGPSCRATFPGKPSARACRRP